MPGQSPNSIVSVSVSLNPTSAVLRNFGNLLIVGASQVIDTAERIRQYSSISGVGADFAPSTPEYQAAQRFFQQSPTPGLVRIGSWAKTATAGVLHCGSLTAAQQLISAWVGITTGSVKFTIDGVLRTLTPLNFSGVVNMNGVAAVINTALAAWATCVWNATYSRFDITSATTGPVSAVSYGSATGAGVDISAQIKSTSATGALAPVGGGALESLISCINLLAEKSNDWYGLYVAPVVSDAENLAVAAFIEAANPSRAFAVTSQDANVLSAAATTDLPYQLKASGYQRTFTQYSSTDPYCAVSIFGKIFTVDFSGMGTTITAAFKTEPGVMPETLTDTQAAAARGKNCNIYANYSDGSAFITPGIMCGGWWIDERHGLDWMQDYIQRAGITAIQTAGKIPQTDAGMNTLVGAYSAACAQAKRNGLLAGGLWTGAEFGTLKSGQMLAEGYYVYAAPISQQDPVSRGARIAPLTQIAAKLAGAIHTSNVTIGAVR